MAESKAKGAKAESKAKGAKAESKAKEPVETVDEPVVEAENEEQELKAVEDFSIINGFELCDSIKLERVLFGTVGRHGYPEGGLGIGVDPEIVLANYDRLGGLIKKDGVKVKTGSFWNFDRRVKAPHQKPQVMFLFSIGGETVEVDDPKNLANAIQTVETAKAEKEEKVRAGRERMKAREMNA